MSVIRQQFAKIYHFLVILVVLFALNAVFNYRYDWGGVSVIVRTYIFVLIFYFVFIFSQLQYEDLIVQYVERYGRRRARYRLFFDIRAVPFIFAFVLTVLFTLVNYAGGPGWPFEPFIRLLDGKYSNTLFYALILFFVLRQNRRPGIAIPVFMAISVLFFVIDKFLYYAISPGTGIGMVKLGKYIIFIFILVYDYSRSRMRLIKAVIISVFFGLIMFFFTASLLYGSYIVARSIGKPASLPVRMLLKTGFISQLDRLESVAGTYGKTSDVRDLVFYSVKYDRNIGFDNSTWEKVLDKVDVDTAEGVFEYLGGRNILLDFNFLSGFAEKKSVSETAAFASSEKFKRYFSVYFRDNSESYMSMFSNGNKSMKLWIIDCLAYAENPDALTFLINFLTSLDRDISRHAYSSLRGITNIDPARQMGREIYDLDVVNEFYRYRDDKLVKNR